MITQEQAFGMYLSKKVLTKDNTIEELIAVTMDGGRATTWNEETLYESRWHLPFNHCKLILRPFEDMTEEEKFQAYNETNAGFEEANNIKDFIPAFEYLISIGVDVFNLKDRGWAIYEQEGGK